MDLCWACYNLMTPSQALDMCQKPHSIFRIAWDVNWLSTMIMAYPKLMDNLPQWIHIDVKRHSKNGWYLYESTLKHSHPRPATLVRTIHFRKKYKHCKMVPSILNHCKWFSRIISRGLIEAGGSMFPSEVMYRETYAVSVLNLGPNSN